jgi:hypothetical protein
MLISGVQFQYFALRFGCLRNRGLGSVLFFVLFSFQLSATKRTMNGSLCFNVCLCKCYMMHQHIICVNQFTKEIPNFTSTLLIAFIARRSHFDSEKQKVIHEFERSRLLNFQLTH